MSGRNTQCTPQVTRQIARKIAEGLSNRDAVALAGVDESSFYGWLRRGEAEYNRLTESPRRKPKDSEAPFLQFFQSIKRAVPKRKQVLVGVITQAAQGGDRFTETKRTYKQVEQMDVDGKPYFAPILVEEIVTEKIRPSEWTAAAWLLERLHYDEFGKRSRVDVEDWRTELIELFKQGKITQEQILSEFADTPSLVAGLFESIGLRAIEVGQTQEQGAAGG